MLRDSEDASDAMETGLKQLGMVGLGASEGLLKKSVSQLEEEIRENETAIFMLEAERKKILEGEGQPNNIAQVVIKESTDAGEHARVVRNAPVSDVLIAKQVPSLAADEQEGSTEYLKISPFLKVISRQSSVSSLTGNSVSSFHESDARTCNGDSQYNYGISVVQPDQQVDAAGYEQGGDEVRD